MTKLQKLMQWFDNAVEWIVYSSNDATQISLTVKGALLGIIPYLMIVAGIAHVNVGDSTTLTALVDSIANFVQVALTAVSALVTVYGLARKVFLTIAGKNAQTPPPDSL
jgi:hypothetical protein